jgi:phytoene dehydrogenase-like protein
VTQRITQLLGGIENYAAAPTAWQLDQIKVLQPMLAESVTAVQTLTRTDLEALNKMMRDANIAYIAVPVGGAGGRRPPQ